MKWFVLCLVLLMTQLQLEASTHPRVESRKIDVAGQIHEQEDDVVPVEDDELKFLKKEFTNVRNITRGLGKKKKVVSKLRGEMEKLSEVHMDYMEERGEYDRLLDQYNKQVECMQRKQNTHLCKDMLEPKKKKSNREAYVPPTQNRPMKKSAPVAYEQDTLDDFAFDVETTVFQQPKAKTVKKNVKGDQKSFLKQFDKAIAFEERRLDRCYAREMRNVGKSFEGVVYLQLTVDKLGNLGHLGFENGGDVLPRGVLTCLSTVLHGIRYPEPPLGKSLKVRKPFIFKPYLM
jgi:hypothetical protein